MSSLLFGGSDPLAVPRCCFSNFTAPFVLFWLLLSLILVCVLLLSLSFSPSCHLVISIEGRQLPQRLKIVPTHVKLVFGLQVFVDSLKFFCLSVSGSRHLKGNLNHICLVWFFCLLITQPHLIFQPLKVTRRQEQIKKFLSEDRPPHVTRLSETSFPQHLSATRGALVTSVMAARSFSRSTNRKRSETPSNVILYFRMGSTVCVKIMLFRYSFSVLWRCPWHLVWLSWTPRLNPRWRILRVTLMVYFNSPCCCSSEVGRPSLRLYDFKLSKSHTRVKQSDPRLPNNLFWMFYSLWWIWRYVHRPLFAYQGYIDGMLLPSLKSPPWYVLHHLEKIYFCVFYPEQWFWHQTLLDA